MNNNKLRRKMIADNIATLLTMDTNDLSVAQLFSSILRSKYYRDLKDVYFASDEEISNVIEQHIAELKISDENVSDEDLNDFFYRNTER